MRKALFAFAILGPILLFAGPRNPLPRTPDQSWQNDLDLNRNVETVRIELDNLSIVNVKSRVYGAKGDGVTDDHDSIEAALATGKSVFFPEGTYLTIGSHTLTSSQMVFGKGKTFTVIKRSSGDHPLFVLTSSSSISEMTLDGNNLSGSVLVSSRTEHSIIKNVKFINVAGTDYALQLTRNTFYVNAEGIEFLNNYGNIYLDGVYYSSFYRTEMYGPNQGYGILFSTTFGGGQTDLNFYDTYMESRINMTTFGVRDIRFIGMRVRLDQMPGPWWNATYNPGSEVAQVTLENASLVKRVNISSIPVFDVSSYQLYLNNVHIYDAVSSSSWSVIKDRGTNNLRLQDFTVESANYWLLFSTDSTGGLSTNADTVNYTQGVTGLAVWSGAIFPGEDNDHGTVRNSNLNHSLSSNRSGGIVFEHIRGNVDLTNGNVAADPIYLFDVTGTITDPFKLAWDVVVSSATTTAAPVAASGTYFDIGAISLPKGNWIISGMAVYTAAGASFASTDFRLGIGNVTGSSSSGLIEGSNNILDIGVSTTTWSIKSMTLHPWETGDLTVQTTYYLKGYVGSFVSGTPTYKGQISGHRVWTR